MRWELAASILLLQTAKVCRNELSRLADIRNRSNARLFLEVYIAVS